MAVSNRELAEEIADIKAKTGAYLCSGAAAAVTGALALIAYSFIFDLNDYLTFHNGNDSGAKLHNVDIGGLWLRGAVIIVLAALILLLMIRLVKNLRTVRRKLPAAVISIVMVVLLTPISGYLILCLTAL